MFFLKLLAPNRSSLLKVTHPGSRPQKACCSNAILDLLPEIIPQKVLRRLTFRLPIRHPLPPHLLFLVMNGFAEAKQMIIPWGTLKNRGLQNLLNGLRNYANFS